MEYTSANARFYVYVELQNGTPPIKIHEKLLLALPDNAPSYSTIKLWCRDMTSGKRESLSDRPRPGAPRTSTDDCHVQQV